VALAYSARSARPRRFKRTPLRLALLALGLLALAGGTLHLLARHWSPSRERFPVQGVGVSAQSGAIDWPSARAAGADFAYLAATSGNGRLDPRFTINLAGARQAGLRYGAEHRFSLCNGADAQAMRFIASVPRDAAMLPPAVRLDFDESCPLRPSRDKLLSELNTFLNQIEAHGGKPAILRVSRAFNAQYDIGGGVNRTLWLEGNVFVPDYAGRPWVMWTASTWKRVTGITGPMDWNVVRP
jgi:lysozyme